MSFFRKIIQQLLPKEVLPTAERRESVRLSFRTDMEVEHGDKRLPAQLLNLTFTGVCLELDQTLEEEETITLRRDEVGPPFQGTVLWSKPKGKGRFLVGVQCELEEKNLVESWLYQTLIQAGFEADYVDEKRSLIRVPGRIGCKLTSISDEELGKGQMLDLSTGGALLEWETEIPIVTAVSFETDSLGGLKPLQGKGTIASSRQNKEGKWLCGLQFTRTDEEAVQEYMSAMLASKSS